MSTYSSAFFVQKYLCAGRVPLVLFEQVDHVCKERELAIKSGPAFAVLVVLSADHRCAPAYRGRHDVT